MGGWEELVFACRFLVDVDAEVDVCRAQSLKLRDVKRKVAGPCVFGQKSYFSKNHLTKPLHPLNHPHALIAVSHTLSKMPQFTGPLTYQINSTTPTPYTTARKWLSAYTARSQSHAHMHPDAQLSRSSISFGTHGPAGGVTLSQVRKLARGLAGERVTPEPEELPEGNDQMLDAKGQHGKKRKADMTTESEWEDPEAWAEKQGGVEIGEVGERSNFVAEVEEVPEVEELDEAEAEKLEAAKSSDKVVDKEEKRRLKKEAKKNAAREREENKKKDAQRRKQAEDDDEA